MVSCQGKDSPSCSKLIGYVHNYAKRAVIGGSCWGHLISLFISRPGSLRDLRCTPEVLADPVPHVQIVHAFLGLYSCFLVYFSIFVVESWNVRFSCCYLPLLLLCGCNIPFFFAFSTVFLSVFILFLYWSLS